MKYNSNRPLAVLLGMGFSLAQLQAQTTLPGDLILFFQKPGNVNTVYVNLGNAATLYRGAETGPSAAKQTLGIINISATLVSAFGTEWASDPNIYAGMSGVFSSETTSIVVDGDKYRTHYVSRARPSVGTLGSAGAVSYNLVSAGALTSGATDMASMNSNFANRLPDLRQGVLGTDLSFIDNLNPTTLAGVQSQAFSQYTSGVQQRGSASAFGTFGPAGQVEFALDLQRLIPNGSLITGEIAPTPSQPSGRIGTYEGTVVVGTNGSVSFITQAVASAYTDWAITNGVPGQAINLDHDDDGVSNGVEYFLVGPNTVSTGFTSVPGVNTTAGGVSSVTWPKAGTYTGAYGTDFWVETSTSLDAGSWTNETLGGNVAITGNNVKYTFPAGPVKTFARLKVTGP